MTAVELVALVVAAFAGSAAQSATGFGVALPIAPIAFALLPAEDAVLLVALASLLHNLLLIGNRRGELGVRRADAVVVAAVALPVLVAGALVVAHIAKAPLQLALAATVLAAVLTGLHEPGRSALLASRGAAVLTGLLAGGLTTTVGVNGPPLVVWLRARGASIAELRDTLAVVFLALNGTAATIFLARGNPIHADALAALAAGLFAGHPIGMLAGRRLDAGRLHAALTTLLVATATGTAIAGAGSLVDDAVRSDEPPPRSASPSSMLLQPVPAPDEAVPPADAPHAAGDPSIAWRDSRALGLPYARGRLRGGVRLPAQGPDWFTWDPVRKRSPNRPWRRWGTDRLLRMLLQVLRGYRAADPGAPRVGIGDLSRPHGGEFGERFGGLGHASHQNGCDVDVYYPRRDGLERRPHRPGQVDRRRAQDLIGRFVEAGAQKLFVGPRLRLHGPKRVVSGLVHHDDHLHVRIRAPRP